jgi:hypothetical protein
LKATTEGSKSQSTSADAGRCSYSSRSWAEVLYDAKNLDSNQAGNCLHAASLISDNLSLISFSYFRVGDRGFSCFLWNLFFSNLLI